MPRPRLAEKLDEGFVAGRRLTLVSAPPGFGKTTCVSQWLDSAGLPVAWLSLEPADNDPTRFLAYVLAALQEIDYSIGREAEAALQSGQPPAIAALTAGLLNDVLRFGARFCLVLDDFHTINQAAILDWVGTLLTGGPDNLHLVLVTREDPPLALGRLRAHDWLTELRAADLRFSEDEARGLLNERLGLALAGADVAALEQRTEGWVAGLQLAGLSIRGQVDPSGFIARLSGSHRYILNYLTEEVLDRQPPDVREFLVRTSILDRFNGELCGAVTGRSDCARLLEQAAAANLFLIPLDDSGEWHRYHHLFGELLQTRLRQTSAAGEVQGLHSRASAWLAAHGEADEAIRHALAGKDFEQAATLVDGVARGMIFAGRMHTLQRWILALPPDVRAAYPRLEVYRMWTELLEGNLDPDDSAAREREEMMQSLPPSPENDRLRVELAAILCRYSPLFGNTQAAIRLARSALASIDKADDVGRARLLFGLAVAHGLEGNAADAQDEFGECLRLAFAAGDEGLAADVLGLEAQDNMHCGRLGEAARLYQEIVDLAARRAGEGVRADEAPVAGLGYLGLAEVELERYQLDQAEAHLELGMELCARGGLDGIYAGYRIRARLSQTRGDLGAALADIEALERAFRRGDDPIVAERRVLIARDAGDTAEIGRVLAPWNRLLASAASPSLVLDVVKALVAQGLLALGEHEEVLALLAPVEPAALQDGRFGLLIEVCLLQALALQAEHVAGHASDPPVRKGASRVSEAARRSLVRSLELAESEGYALTFLEQMPAVGPLLSAVRDDIHTDLRVREYAGKLLAAPARPSAARLEAEATPASLQVDPGAGSREGPAGSGTPDGGEGVAAGVAEPALLEPLSGREIELLRLIGEGCTNQEIAGRLNITLHTVKKHSSNIFGKLGVSSRTQAIARARRLGLIT